MKRLRPIGWQRVLLSAGLGLVLSATVPAAEMKIAIWRLKPLGLDAATAERLEILLRAETSRIGGFLLQEKEQTQATLSTPANAELRRCGGNTACLCEIGKALGVNHLVTGVIGALGDDYTFDLKLVNIEGCREERRINEALSGREDLLIGAIRGALYKLVVPEQFVGSLSVEVPVAGAEILVNGEQVGTAPLAELVTGLRPGTQKLQIRKKGYSSFEDHVPIRFQQITRVKVDLVTSALLGISYEKEQEKKEAAPPPPKPPVPKEGTSTTKILAWSTLGLTAAAILGAAFMGWRSQLAQTELKEAVQNHTLIASHQETIDRGEALAFWSNIGWGTAGGAAVLTVVLFLLDAFGDEESQMPMSAQLGPEGWGMVLQWPF